MAQDNPADSTNGNRAEVFDTTHWSVVLQAGGNDSPQAAAALAAATGAVTADTAAALADPAVDALLIASSTDTHADLIKADKRILISRTRQRVSNGRQLSCDLPGFAQVVRER